MKHCKVKVTFAVVNNLTSYRLNMIEDIIDEELIAAANKHEEMIQNEQKGIIAINQEIIKNLNQLKILF